MTPDGRMSLREWSRTRRVPVSTAHRAAQAGRISRDADGRLDPRRADREWYVNTRPRADMRHLVVPPEHPDRAVATEPIQMSHEALEDSYECAPDPGETIRVVDAVTVEAELEDLHARELVAAINRAILDIAPRLARPQDAAWLAERLYDALVDSRESTEREWRQRFPRD